MAMKNQTVSGALSSSLTALFVQPFDVVKTAYLTGSRSSRISSSIRYIYQQHGMNGYWRGCNPAMSRALVSGGAGFPILELLKSVLPGGFVSNMLSSALARATVILLVSPLTVLKVRMEAPQASSYASIGEGCLKIYNEVGLRGYYVGLGPNMIRDIPYSGLAYAFYQWYSAWFGDNFIAAAAGSCTASLLTQPFDVLKTRMQFAHIDKDHYHSYNGVKDGIRHVWKLEGLRGFTRGLTIRMTEKSFSYAILWGGYRKIKSWMDSE